MAEQHNGKDEAITEDEITGTAIPGSEPKPKSANNAFTELMSRKPKPQTSPKSYTGRTQFWAPQYWAGRDGLGAYTANPDAWGPERIIFKNDKGVIINDLYPKSTIHTLVLPNSPRNVLHPFDAFEDPQFLAETKVEVDRAIKMVASELRRKYGKFSKTDRARIEAMGSDDPPEHLPPGRDWSKEVITGIHAGPSMNHVHVHVMSRDMVSECMKRDNHYNSFTTPFLVRLEEFPIAKDDYRQRPDHGGLLHVNMECWRCGKNFDNKITKLKAHLLEEFEEWKRE